MLRGDLKQLFPACRIVFIQRGYLKLLFSANRILNNSILQYKRPIHGIPVSHNWDGKPSTCRCCMTGKVPGCPRQMFLSRGPINKVFRRRNMNCLSYVKLFKPSFYCVAEIMFLSQAKLSEFKNIVFLSGQKQSTSLRLPTNLKMHPNLVLI